MLASRGRLRQILIAELWPSRPRTWDISWHVSWHNPTHEKLPPSAASKHLRQPARRGRALPGTGDHGGPGSDRNWAWSQEKVSKTQGHSGVCRSDGRNAVRLG